MGIVVSWRMGVPPTRTWFDTAASQQKMRDRTYRTEEQEELGATVDSNGQIDMFALAPSLNCKSLPHDV